MKFDPKESTIPLEFEILWTETDLVSLDLRKFIRNKAHEHCQIKDWEVKDVKDYSSKGRWTSGNLDGVKFGLDRYGSVFLQKTDFTYSKLVSIQVKG